MDKKNKFYKTYSSLPLGLRDEIILSIDQEPITWKVAKLEIDQDTPLSKTILDKLIDLKII